MERQIPNKLFFKIGEVCEITDTQPYVLRLQAVGSSRYVVQESPAV